MLHPQAEEVKAVRRIEETHRRTHEILAVKTRHQQTEFERQAARTTHEDEMQRHKLSLKQAQEERKYAIMAAKNATMIANANQARAAKLAQAENAMAIARARGAEYNAAASKRNAVRQVRTGST